VKRKQYKNKNYSWKNERKRELLQTKIRKQNLGKPYSNIVPTWRDTAMWTQTGY